jgi:hypothetical protein
MSALDPIAADTGEPARACLAKLRELAGGGDTAMERHCLRVYEIAVALGRKREIELDLELLTCAAWLHDAGLYPGAATSDAYVSDGRRLAEPLVAAFGGPPDRVATLGDAIERHHELRPQWSRGAEVELLRRADLVDVSQGLITFGLDRAWLRALSRRVPRKGMLREIGALLARAARDRPRTLPAIFLRR